jgi:hypothetical protein
MCRRGRKTPTNTIIVRLTPTGSGLPAMPRAGLLRAIPGCCHSFLRAADSAGCRLLAEGRGVVTVARIRPRLRLGPIGNSASNVWREVGGYWARSVTVPQGPRERSLRPYGHAWGTTGPARGIMSAQSNGRGPLHQSIAGAGLPPCVARERP